MVPSGWQEDVLINVLDKIIDYRGQSVPKAESGIPLITARNVRFGYLDFGTEEFIDESQFERWSTRGTPKRGDILFTTEAPLGMACRFPEAGTYGVGQRTVSLRTNPKLSSEFLLYFLLSERGQRLIDIRSSGSTAKGIKSSELKKVKILHPVCVDEQRKIAKILSTWDKAISTTERLIDNSKQQKKALMQQLLTGKKRLLDDSGEPFEGEWEEVKLCKVAEVVMGSSPKSASYNENNEGLPLIQGNADIKNRRSVPRIYTSEVTKRCSVGDILLSVRAPVGTVAKSVHEACIGRGISAISAKKHHVQEYLYQWLLWFEPRWEKYSQGSTFEAVNSNDIKSLHLSIPEHSEQARIAAVLSNADKEIELLEQQLADLKLEKKALMQQLLTGKRRVKVDEEAVA